LFDSAITCFKEYEKHLHKHEKEQQVLEKDIIDKRIMECVSAKELIKKPKAVKITNLGSEINSPFDDYSPAISGDEKTLMFTSRRDQVEEEGNNFSKREQSYFEQVLLSDWRDSVWGPAKSIGENVNGKRHDASVSVSPDGQRLILYKQKEICITANWWTVSGTIQ
jgi:hypothetical protein